jgi:hypothetical protein
MPKSPIVFGFDLNELSMKNYSIFMKHYETNSVNPYSFGAFEVYQECSKRHCGLGDLTMTNKTNKQPSFIKEILTFKNKLGGCKG